MQLVHPNTQVSDSWSRESGGRDPAMVLDRTLAPKGEAHNPATSETPWARLLKVMENLVAMY